MHRDGMNCKGGPHYLNDFKIWIIKIIEKKKRWHQRLSKSINK